MIGISDGGFLGQVAQEVNRIPGEIPSATRSLYDIKEQLSIPGTH